jgi:hypothetical protein
MKPMITVDVKGLDKFQKTLKDMERKMKALDGKKIPAQYIGTDGELNESGKKWLSKQIGLT